MSDTLIRCEGCDRLLHDDRFPGVTTDDGPLCAECVEELAYEHADKVGR